MLNLSNIDQSARRYADAREALTSILDNLQAELDNIKRQHLPALRQAVRVAAEKEAKLKQAIEAAPECFTKPRTQIFHGIRCGFVKGKGSIAWDDADQVVRLIRKHLPSQADTLIRTREEPNKTALKELTVAELKSIGCVTTDTGDAVLIKATDSDVDKLADAMLKEAVDRKLEQAA